jgi:hypothetical protein
MSTNLFTNYSVKGNLKFYKIIDEDEKITISISVNANHELSRDIYQNINNFLENLLIEEYMTEDSYTAKKLHEKMLQKQQKENEKYEKTKAKESKKKAKATKKTASSKSLY